MYKVLSDLTAYVFSDADPTKSWTRRRESQRGTAKLCSTMEQEVKLIPSLTNVVSPVIPPILLSPREMAEQALKLGGQRGTDRAQGLAAGSTTVGVERKGELLLDQFGVNLARKLLGAGTGAREVAEILVGTAAAFVANTATAVG